MHSPEEAAAAITAAKGRRERARGNRAAGIYVDDGAEREALIEQIDAVTDAVLFLLEYLRVD